MQVRNLKKKKGVSLVEIAIAVVLLTFTVSGYFLVMGMEYSNLHRGKKLTKDNFQTKLDNDFAVSKLKNYRLKPGQRLSAAQMAEFTNKDFDLDYESSITLLSSSPEYRFSIDGYVLKKQYKNIGGRSLVSFVANTGVPDVNEPAFVATPKVAVEYSWEKTPGFAILFAQMQGGSYNEKDYTRRYVYASDPVYSVDTDAHKMNLGASYEFTGNTAPLSMYENFEWFASKKYGAIYDGSQFTKTFEPYFRKDEDATIPAPVYSIYPVNSDEFYKIPVNTRTMSTLKMQELNLGDQYVRVKIEPVSSLMVKAKSSVSEPIWIIGLPYTKDLIFHYDPSLEGDFLNVGETQQISGLRDFSEPVSHVMATPFAGLSGNVTLNKGDKYGKYASVNTELSTSERRGGDYNKLTLIMRLKPHSDGTIMRRNPKSNGFGWELYVKNNKIVLCVPGVNSAFIKKEISFPYKKNKFNTVVVRVEYNEIGLQVGSKSAKKDRTWSTLNFSRSGDLYLGGSGAKFDVEEIIGYDDILSDENVQSVTEYLKDKYE